ncbi:MAG: PocR ligand-binding domain-containing protein [Clostridia bacterium]|nr:PocR ligand-binding domain-containing protein [Clostridia bacterium]
MSILFEDEELRVLMEDFYILTGIRLVLFDADFVEVISYPTSKDTFCGLMRKNKEFDELCHSCDMSACRHSLKTKSTYIYTCHAGLTEAVSPIFENEIIIGYIMFGQVSEMQNKEQLNLNIKSLCEKYMPDTVIDKKIKQKSHRQILAASKILDALAEYIRLKGMVRLSDTQVITKINNYIISNIESDIAVYDLCNELGVCRTRLYEIVKKQTGEGVSSFIRSKRLNYAKKLIKTTDLTITEIALKSGFSDYNYFLRLFKKHFGVSPKKLQKSCTV